LRASANTATLFPTWKQEVNQRVAAHKRSKAAPAGATLKPSDGRLASTSRAAQAAARVAERFAHAPSYNEVLANEARAAVRAAEAASIAAQEAHAAVQYVLEGIEAASIDASSIDSAAQHAWEPDLPARQTDPVPAPARATSIRQRPTKAEAHSEDSHEPVSPFNSLPFPASLGDGDASTAEPAQPVHANIIQFPREVIATRRLRPRLAEGPLAVTEARPQLSIFEVDPGTISTEPAAAVVDVPAAPAWMRRELLQPELPAIELETQPQEEIVEESALQPSAVDALELAPMSRRLLAVVVDCALIAAAFLAAAMPVAAHVRALPGLRIVELSSVLALLAIGAAYQTLFFTVAKATPGMRYAGIGLSTLDGFSPSRAQRCGRLMALPLSVLPLGLGLAWALFDESRLTWHDRLSRTYLRKR